MEETTRCEDCNGTGSICAPQEPQAFCIDSEKAADWLLQQYAALDAEIALITAQAQAAVKRLQADRQSLEHLYQEQLEAFIRERIADDRRGRKSVILPHGTVGFRTVPASVKLVNSEAALAYARENRWHQCVRIAVSLDTVTYREVAEEMLEETGELLPGMESVPAREAFYTKKGKEA